MRPSVVIPLGPKKHHMRWLDEAIASVEAQRLQPSDVVIIDDGGERWRRTSTYKGCRIWSTPWPTGVAAAFNTGVAVADGEYVFMLGADDWLEPDCLEKCAAAAMRHKEDPLGYYWVAVRYTDGREDAVQNIACNAAMVTKTLWQHCGGFPIESASGAPDAALISIFYAHHDAGHLYEVSPHPLYNYRSHPDTDTASRGPWQNVILETRDLLTAQWRPRNGTA